MNEAKSTTSSSMMTISNIKDEFNKHQTDHQFFPSLKSEIKLEDLEILTAKL